MRTSHLMNQRGMTLIELVIAISITAIIGVISAQLLNAMITNSEQITRHKADLERFDRNLRIFQSDLDQLVIRTNNGILSAADSNIPGLLIEFTRLHTQPDLQMGEERLERIRYVQDSNSIIRYSTPVGLPIDEDHWYQQTLFSDVSEIRFNFLYDDWYTSPQATNTSPLGAIHLEVSSDRWDSFELVVMVRSGAEN